MAAKSNVELMRQLMAEYLDAMNMSETDRQQEYGTRGIDLILDRIHQLLTDHLQLRGAIFGDPKHHM